MQLSVTFPAGQRKQETEVVDLIGADVLKEVLRDVVVGPPPQKDEEEGVPDDPKEGLKPANMALVSPRVFWSIVYAAGHGDVARALQEMLPDADWSFLDSRVRKLSQRAADAKRTEEVVRATRARGRGRGQGQEAGGAGGAEDEEDSNEQGNEPDDDLSLAVAEREDRETLRSRGITSLEALASAADIEEEFRDVRTVARSKVAEEWTKTKILREDCDPSLLAKLHAINVRTPGDVHFLKVPGRSEFAAGELGVALDIVLELRRRADELVGVAPWVKEIRTRG